MTFRPTSFDNGLASVMIVDDSIGIRKFLAVAMRRMGLNPIEAPDLATAREKVEGVDAIILDMGLPDGDGLDFLEEVRRTVHLREIPTIVLTVRNDPASRARARELGVAAWMTKPFRTEDFIATLKAVLPETKE